jgi:hypothetical protein
MAMKGAACTAAAKAAETKVVRKVTFMVRWALGRRRAAKGYK